jgi:hypothetical protein
MLLGMREKRVSLRDTLEAEDVTLRVAGEASGSLAGQATNPGPLPAGTIQPVNGPRAGSDKFCTNCETTSTSMWRKQKHTKQDLCNKCGIHHSKHGRHRDPNAPAKRGGVRKVSSAKVCCQNWPQLCVVVQLAVDVCRNQANFPSAFYPLGRLR